MINRMLQGKAPIIYGDGMQTRCFSYIDDCLSCLIPMLDEKKDIYYCRFSGILNSILKRKSWYRPKIN